MTGVLATVCAVAVLLSANVTMGAATTASLLPAYYDARQAGKTPLVKSQGTLGTCWAITATSALEAALMPEQHKVFSADHLSLNNSFTIDQNDGGDYKMIMAYLAGWQGPVLEEDDPYGDQKTVDGLEPQLHVQEMRVLEGATREEFKRALMEYGPLQTSLYMNRKVTGSAYSYYNEETYAYRYPAQEKPDHDILILGWDDTFAASNFKQAPVEAGAWICQNTWGEDFGENGVFYVSYADANIARTGLVYSAVEDTDNYDHLYQTDECGWQGAQGYKSSEAWFANVYEAGGSEELTAAGFYSTGSSSEAEVYVVENYYAYTSLLRMGEPAASVTLDGQGYFTVELDQPVSLQEGQKFAVIVHINTEGAVNPIAVEMEKDAYTANVTTLGKEGYLSRDGQTWENAEEKYDTNICLKAYTRETGE